MDANTIYEEAQRELDLASKAYSAAYAIRQSLFQITSAVASVGIWGRQGKPSVKQAKAISEYMRESTKHRNRHKKLMAKLTWNETLKEYQL